MEKFFWRLFAIALFACDIWSIMFLFVSESVASTLFFALVLVANYLYFRFEPTWL